MIGYIISALILALIAALGFWDENRRKERYNRALDVLQDMDKHNVRKISLRSSGHIYVEMEGGEGHEAREVVRVMIDVLDKTAETTLRKVPRL